MLGAAAVVAIRCRAVERERGNMNGSHPTLRWRKSRASGSGNCVEVAKGNEFVFLRDSKAPQGPVLAFTAGEWNAFLAGVGADEFTLAALES
jgi:Domain of unknown function (DUF397)